MADRVNDMVCKALEMAEKSVAYYKEATASCTQSLGKEVFESLQEDKRKHMERIQQVRDDLEQGKSVSQACTLDEGEEEHLGRVFADFAAKYEPAACPASEKAALETALDMEKSILDFYGQSLSRAGEEAERLFIQALVRDVRSHLLMLEDMHHYYDDPEGWMMDKESAGLDGA